MSAATAAIQFALNLRDDSELDFLRVWNEGDFDAIRKEWPEAPQTIYAGADSLSYAPATKGESWALIAHSWMAGAGSVLAASADICALIETAGIDRVFVFPEDGSDPGIYLWHGQFDQTTGDFEGPPAEKIDASEMDNWLIRHDRNP